MIQTLPQYILEWEQTTWLTYKKEPNKNNYIIIQWCELNGLKPHQGLDKMEPALQKTNVHGWPCSSVLDDLENKNLYMFWREKNQISSWDYLFNLLCPEILGYAGKGATFPSKRMVDQRSPRQLSSSDLESVGRPLLQPVCCVSLRVPCNKQLFSQYFSSNCL